MPGILASTGRPPRLAIAVQAMLSIAAVLVASLLQLMTYLGLTLSVCGALSVLAVWFVRRRLPHAQPLTWWERLAVVIYLGITGCILVGAWSEKWEEFRAMLITFAIGLLAYWLCLGKPAVLKHPRVETSVWWESWAMYRASYS